MTDNNLIHQNSVILVSGGARGITAKCVIELAQQHPAKYILLGRSVIDKPVPDWAENCPDDADLKQRIMRDLTKQGRNPTPKSINQQFMAIRSQEEVEDTLTKIQKTGSKVVYVSVDVTDEAMMKERIEDLIQELGPITGVIHGAGALADRRIQNKTPKDYDKVTSPKITGLKNLLTIAPLASLDFLILFSSIVGIYGNIGQTDYAIANEVLNKAAYQAKRDYPNCRVISINWGPWDSGMVTPELKRAFAERKMSLIPSDAGATWMVKMLTSAEVEDDLVQVVFGAIPTRSAWPHTTELGKQLISRLLNLESNPFLSDHTIGGHPVLPATCAASWIATTCEELCPGYTFFQMDEFKVLKGIVFDESQSAEYLLELYETQSNSEDEVQFSARIYSHNGNGNVLYHYQADIVLLKELPTAPKYALQKDFNNLEQEIIQSDLLYSDGTLFHGPSFKGIKEILHITKDRLISLCSFPKLSPEDQGQFLVRTANPFVNDVIVQSLLIWTQVFLKMPCLPSYLECMEQFRKIPIDQPCYVDMRIISQTDTSVIGDLYVVDENGNLMAKLTHLQGTISPLLNRLIGRKSDNTINNGHV